MTSIAERYEKFQSEAVGNIVRDFRESRAGRFLLVIPTGGGKTMTAVKAIGALYAEGILSEHERVMWVVHREELHTQAGNALKEYSEARGAVNLSGRVDVLMLSAVAGYLNDNNPSSFAVIDEAHHGAAASYQALFNQPKFGILGLTATPSRHDGLPLSFDRESYSIGFPDLVKLGVLLLPKIVEVKGGAYDIDDIQDGATGLEVLNNTARNEAILKAVNSLGDKIAKAIIYVGTAQHARDLFGEIRAAKWASRFSTVALVLGSERRRVLTATGQEQGQEDRRDFMQALKAAPTALIVNVDVLTEGFDDPGVNTVVMARPTKSKLVYMQAIGRAVRLNKDNLSKEAYIVEVVDDLPNIRYRIDNRWLFSDISDLLEPSVEDRFYTSRSKIEQMLQAAFEEFKVSEEYREIPEVAEHDRVTMLLFKVYRGDGNYEHVPFVITNASRTQASSFFNFLSMRMKSLKDKDIEASIRPVLAQVERFKVGTTSRGRKRVFHAMQNAFGLIHQREQAVDQVLSGQPWITFIAFRLELNPAELSDDLLQFTEDMLNRDWVRKELRSDAISPEFALVKFPLPLKGFIGVFLSPGEMNPIVDAVDKLRECKGLQDGVQQWTQAKLVIGTAALPIETRFVEALPTIVREDLDYYRWLTPSN